MLKKKNKELELMLLKAHSYVAAATDGYQHYSTVFADGIPCDNNGCDKENHIDGIEEHQRSSAPSGSDDDDDDHSLSFLWR